MIQGHYGPLVSLNTDKSIIYSRISYKFSDICNTHRSVGTPWYTYFYNTCNNSLYKKIKSLIIIVVAFVSVAFLGIGNGISVDCNFVDW